MGEHPFGHESSAIDIRRILLGMGILAATVLLAIGILYLLLHHEVLPHHTQVVTEAGMIPPSPRLQADPPVDKAAERVQKQQLLSHYAWLDSSHDFARIPLQRAMQLYVQRQSRHENLRPATTARMPEESR